MKTLLILIKAGIFFPAFIFSQNLVPNGSFENYTSCPNSYSQIYKAVPWFQPNISQGDIINSSTSDFYNICATSTFADVPKNSLGFQNARTGNGYSGILLIGSAGSFDIREYIEVSLIDTLEMGSKYCVEFHVSLADSSHWAIADMGIYFSADSVLDTSFYSPLQQYSPQISNPISNIISDTMNWSKISDVYVAQGVEKFITIGNFKYNASTNVLFVGDSSNITDTAAYYYIDDVSLYEIDEIFPANLAGSDATVCAGSAVTIGSPSIPGFKYQWQPATYLSSDTVAQPLITQLPNNPITLTYILQITNDSVPYSCKPTATDTVTVTIKPLPVFTITATEDTVCTGSSATLTAQVGFNYLWSTGDTGATITVFPQTDTLIIAIATDSSCSYTDSIVIKAVQTPVSTITAGSNSVCSGETTALTGAGGTNYLWSTGETTPSIFPILTTTSTFFLTVTNPPCTATNSVSIAVTDCPQPKENIAFLPSIFSPNGDGNNDYFGVRGANIAEIHLTIYNRWGEKVFETKVQTESWNGTYKEQQLNTGVFVYFCKITFEDGEKREVKGNVTLVR